MPPKKGKLHELAAEVKVGHEIIDTKKKKFIVGKQFATGGFGRIYFCNEEGKSEQLVIKIEPSGNGPLFTEVSVFQRILKPEQLEEYKKKNNISSLGLPWLISCGVFNYNADKMRFMIIPKYSTSLESVREDSSGKLTVKQTMEVTLEILRALEYLHEMDYTHADVKAANILLLKKTDFSSAVLVDFGLARLSTKNEDKPEKKRAHNGTCIFTSVDAHRGCNPSYRGDIEILAYNIIYWLTGTLPWMEMESAPEKVYAAKQKFLGNAKASLKTVLKNHPEAQTCCEKLFEVAEQTKYTSKIEFSQLYPIVRNMISKAPSKPVATPKRGKAAQKPVESDESPESPIVKRPVASQRASTAKRITRKRTSEENEEAGPSKLSPVTRSTKRIPDAKVVLAKKIGNKYKRMSLNRSVLQPIVDEKKPEQSAKSPKAATPVLERVMRTRSGVSAAMKASPRQLRNVPGVQNFPKGRRSMMIKEINAKYSHHRSENGTSPNTSKQ